MIETNSPQIKKLRTRAACWMTKPTKTHSVSDTYCFTTLTMVMGTRLNISFIRTSPVFLLLPSRMLCIESYIMKSIL